MRYAGIFSAITLLWQSTAVWAGTPQAGQIWMQANFDDPDAMKRWAGRATLDAAPDGRQALLLATAPGQSGATVTTPVPLGDLRGCTLRCTASIRAQEVADKPNPWNGVKFMLVIAATSGTTYPQAPLETGTFGWKKASFLARIPADATNLNLVLGLEKVTGKAWFDDVSLTIVRTPLPAPPPVSGPRFKGHDLARLRGAMVSPSINPESLRLFGQEWNANLVRWQLIRHGTPGQSSSLETFDDWLEGELARLDAALPYCAQYGLKVVLDLHSPPGGKATVSGYIGSDDRLFTDKRCQDKFVATWRRIAERYKASRVFWGYDLANEPVEDDVADGCDDWQRLAERAARAVREVDPQRTLIVEPPRWGGPDGLNDLVPIPVSNVVYSVHMYLPHTFTHQGVHAKGQSFGYPGEIEGRWWDKAQLEKALQPAIDFQNRYNVHLYIGEFSAIRWAPDHSAVRYLNDLIEIFEARQWDWSYHAFREWSGWSVEHGSDPADDRPSPTPTDRQKLLRSWFSRNEKPQG